MLRPRVSEASFPYRVPLFRGCVLESRDWKVRSRNIVALNPFSALRSRVGGAQARDGAMKCRDFAAKARVGVSGSRVGTAETRVDSMKSSVGMAESRNIVALNPSSVLRSRVDAAESR